MRCILKGFLILAFASLLGCSSWFHSSDQEKQITETLKPIQYPTGVKHVTEKSYYPTPGVGVGEAPTANVNLVPPGAGKVGS